METLVNATRIEADYLLETPSDPRRVAEIMAGEQSSGTFVPVPGETPELKARAAARIESLRILGERVARPTLPSHAVRPDSTAQRALVTISWPLDNLGPSLPNLIATVAGNLYELQDVTGLKLLDIRLPEAFANAYPGPRFGITGTRQLTDVARGPVIGTIIKPSVGLRADETAALVAKLCEAGIDFIKDDELQADGATCPFEDRVRAVMRVIDESAQRTGKRTMYAFNLTGDVEQMKRRHDVLLSSGATCLMVSLNSVGLAGFSELARIAELPIHAHRNGWGYLSRHPLLGWSYVAWQKLWRLAGADHMHVNGLASKFAEADESVVQSARACLTPLFPGKPCLAMPVFSSGQSARQAPATFASLKCTDLIVTAGGAIMAHPGGPAEGVVALRQGWEAAEQGAPLSEFAVTRPALKQALESA